MVVITVRPLPVVSSRRRSRELDACSGAGKPQRSKVLAICRSSCVRSVTTTMAGLPRRGSRRSFVASHSIVSDLPEPCVCHTTPPSLLRLAARQEAPQRRTHGPVLLVPWQLLHQPPSLRLVDHVVAQDIE